MAELQTDTNSDNPEKKRWDSWKAQPTDSFIYQVQSGREGNNAGLANGLHRINNYIYGTNRARYYLIGADSGAGKTTLTDFMFVINAWQAAKLKGIPIKIFYCSFEISKIEKVAKWVSYYIEKLHGKCIPSSYIIGRIHQNYLTPEELELVQSAYKMVEEMLKDIILIDSAVHPTSVFENIIEHHYETAGTVTREPVSAEDKAKGKKGRVLKYVANNPTAMTMLIVDHMALANPEMGLTLKGTIDKLSRYAIVLRNLFGCTIAFIQQFSTDLMQLKRSSMDKLQGAAKANAIRPVRLDFGDSKAPFRDADVVLGLVKPREFDIDDFHGINTSSLANGGMGDYMVAAYVMKHRYGPYNRCIPLYMNPIAGVFAELSNSLDSEAHAPWYVKARELDAITRKYEPNT
jgi:DnaB-like helicase C terminal domain